jgi:hypothetical protein
MTFDLFITCTVGMIEEDDAASSDVDLLEIFEEVQRNITPLSVVQEQHEDIEQVVAPSIVLEGGLEASDYEAKV